jgi:hypothetical protein
MGAPLILSKNRNGSPENSTPPQALQVAEEPTPTEITEHEEDKAVNGRLELNIKDNSDNNNIIVHSYHQRPQQPTDFRHNYH